MPNKAINKKLLFITSAVLIAGVMLVLPVYGKRSIFHHIFSSPEKQSSGLSNNEPVNTDKKTSLKDVWDDLQKLAQNNRMDTATVNGKVKLYDNLDEEGIKEEQNFLLQQEGKNQRFKLETFENIHIGHNVLLIDHNEKEIVLQSSQQADSIVAALQSLSSGKLRKVLEKDGTTGDIATEGDLKVMSIRPGDMDAVNEYKIYYDPATYQIRKLKVAYTSFPYQDLIENYQPSVKARGANEEISAEDVKADETEIEANVTEYVIEFDFLQVKKENSFNFQNNELFRLNAEGIEIKQQLRDYKLINF